MVKRSLRVLATLSHGQETYRVFADLIVSGSLNQLRLHRFDDSDGDCATTDHQGLIVIPSSVVRAIDSGITGASHVLVETVHLDAQALNALFGFDARAAA